MKGPLIKLTPTWIKRSVSHQLRTCTQCSNKGTHGDGQRGRLLLWYFSPISFSGRRGTVRLISFRWRGRLFCPSFSRPDWSSGSLRQYKPVSGIGHKAREGVEDMAELRVF